MDLRRSETDKKVAQAKISRAEGVLVGAAAGDALGAPFEFQSAGRYSARFPAPQLEGGGEMIGGGAFDWEPGEFTDDTQMSVVLGESILARNGIDEDDLWMRFRAWAAAASDVGGIIRTATSHASWKGAAASAHSALGRSAGNGALMRIAPIALAMGGASPADVMAAACRQSALTHWDPSAQWGAAICAELIRRLVAGDGGTGTGGADSLPGSRLQDLIDEILPLVPADIRDRFEEILSVDWLPDGTAAGANRMRFPVPGNGTVWTCLAQAAWAVRSTRSFEAAVTAAVDLGSDTDTVACVAGAIAGGLYGFDAIPPRWTRSLHGRVRMPDSTERRYDVEALRMLARRLNGLPTGL